ncbi:MAG: alpha/beta hydrolase [Rhizobiales bacterium]|nr:alpha/beta hydrolase [Hyphomicrobiales bacterium]
MSEEKGQRPRAHRDEYRGASGHRLAASRYAPLASPTAVALLLHGGGQTRHAWDATAARLAEQGALAICVDQRGHGDSAWIGEGAYAFFDYGEDARALAMQIAADEGRKPVAIGASMGGIASLLALSHDADCFAGLVLVDVTPRLDSSGVDHITGFMRERAAQGFASIEEAAEAVARYLPHRPRPKSLDGLRKNLRLREGRYYWHWDPRFLDGPRSVETDAARVAASLEDAARSLSVPTLLVRGQSSELVGEAEAKHFLELCPGAEMVDVAGARHMVAGDRNDVFAAAILDFLKRRF